MNFFILLILLLIQQIYATGHRDRALSCSCKQHTLMARGVWGNGHFHSIDWIKDAQEYSRKVQHVKRQTSNVAQIFLGNIATMTPGQETQTAQAIAIDQQGIIIKSGTVAEIQALPGASTAKVNDWGNKTIFPGFWDVHNHFFSTGLGYADPNNLLVYYPKVRTLDDVNSILSAQAKKLDAAGAPVNVSVFAFGWDLLLQTPSRNLNKADLDAISTTRPVVVIANTAHTGYANSMALKMAGITSDTPPLPGGGVFEKGVDSQLTGVFQESAVIYMTSKFLNTPSDPTQSIMGVIKYLTINAGRGVTSLGDGVSGSVLGIQNETALWPALFQKTGVGIMPTRIVLNPDGAQVAKARAILNALNATQLNPFGVWSLTGNVDPIVTMARSKMFLDGSNQAKSAAQTIPYLQSPGEQALVYGSLNWNDSEVLRIMQSAKDNGFSTMAHINGDKSTAQLLAAITAVYGTPAKTKRQSNGWTNVQDYWRNLCIHVAIANEGQYDQMKSLNLSTTYLTDQIRYWGRSFKDTLVGPPRSDNMAAAGWAYNRQIPFSAHSDAPIVETADPLAYISTLATRQVQQGPGAPYIQGGNLTVPVIQAIKALTIYPAYQMGLEKYVGTLEPGKLFDAVVLDKDIRTMNPLDIAYAGVLQTYVSGRKINATFAGAITTGTTSATQTTQSVTRTSDAKGLFVGVMFLMVLLI